MQPQQHQALPIMSLLQASLISQLKRPCCCSLCSCQAELSLLQASLISQLERPCCCSLCSCQAELSSCCLVATSCRWLRHPSMLLLEGRTSRIYQKNNGLFLRNIIYSADHRSITSLVSVVGLSHLSNTACLSIS
ncbi:uncharacterized protein PSFLO_06913 [Pseudozyma flocculosa]|uniref:Uncharacterized protein n=1 Tax=Pseudozyma flocculosa TaxID=84751 RepID=A0A5C3FD95_9BASI|nr:uncharacterized protein PSFLO_06913 [Pseudozyma flocculosa]